METREVKMTFKSLMFIYVYLWVYWYFVAGPRVRWLIYGAIFCATGMWINVLLNGKPGDWEGVFKVFAFLLIMSNPFAEKIWRAFGRRSYYDHY